MRIQSYRDLRVWQRAIHLVDVVYELTAQFPDSEKFGISSQLRRAAISIAANIAEGHARTTIGEFASQLSVARGSTAEVEVLLLIAEGRGYLNPAELAAAGEECDAISRMITVLKRRLKVHRKVRP
jgi:four helix bundle protein